MKVCRFVVGITMNDSDESTAVFDMKRKYNEFIAGVSGSSSVGVPKLSFEGFNCA